MKTYQLAKETPFVVKGFGPLMTLERAEYYQGEMTCAGFPVIIINTKEGPEYGRINHNWTNPKFWERIRKAKKNPFRYVTLAV